MQYARSAGLLPAICNHSNPDWSDAVFAATAEAGRRLTLEDQRLRLLHLTTILPLLNRDSTSFPKRVDEFVDLINETRETLRPWIKFTTAHESMLEKYNRVIGNMKDPEFIKKMDTEAEKMQREYEECKRQEKAQAEIKPVKRRRPAGV